MKLINHIYENKIDLESFIFENKIADCSNILIQIFSALYEKKSNLDLINYLKNVLPNAKIIGATSSYEISSKGLEEENTIISFSLFNNTTIETYIVEGENCSFKSGKKLINKLPNPNDKSIKTAICFSNEIEINGDELLEGINSVNSSIIIAGGIAGDYVDYNNNFVFTQDEISENATVLATLKNPDLNVITDHNLDWDCIGKKHVVTKSIKNRVYEIDNITALQFYKNYLGDDIGDDIIQTCFGIPIIIEKENIKIGRGIFKLHEDESISYSGNINEQDIIRFGYGNTNLILENSKLNILRLKDKPVEGIYIYSCIGRKEAFMNDSINIEIKQYNKVAPMSGFLTHGEFYHGDHKNCKNRFLNQTMTVLALSENNLPCQVIEENKLTKINKKSKRYLALNNLISKTSNELEDLSKNLEERVKEEIEKNEEKDKLIHITQAQAEVGSMLEMIAHQWRQPLSAISSTASAIQIKNELDNLTKKDLEILLDEILDLSSFASQTIEDFRELFNEKQTFEKIKINDLLTKVITILKTLFNHNKICIEEKYLCKTDEILFIPLGQVLQVLINIIKNAVDAIVDNNIKNPKITFLVQKQDDFYTISIQDNGGGIPEEYLQRVFEKRFSTKGKTHGTGIGLDICKSIIEKNLKGSITASNNENGAQFEIKIPKK